jgi:saccharopine dehydrogenase (NAD+, L-lysine-forming)
MAYQDTKAQAVSYTTGVPAALGTSLVARGIWKEPGVNNMEQFDPDPFLEELGPLGLPWEVVVDGKLAFGE